ncbi:protein of unknown function [Xenorhabdus poinarii G6]|uniref:Uncharacterized protein n=1 Tax=Xenorhabdus poinarii G6 TaxID=1354304 RepID=A0A068R656_9GAMM|nr:protein of unknown function [Xenorhabdus poinarii G6]
MINRRVESGMRTDNSPCKAIGLRKTHWVIPSWESNLSRFVIVFYSICHKKITGNILSEGLARRQSTWHPGSAH